MPGPCMRTVIPRPVAASLIIAAANSLYPERADRHCSGVNDHVEILEAIATGLLVFLLDGVYYVEASLALVSHLSLKGCGRGTIITTTTADLDIITATGGPGTELVGITIADLCVDGLAGGVANDRGIQWDYVDRSLIFNVWSRRNGEEGIILTNSDYNRIVTNDCELNDEGLEIASGVKNIVTGNQLVPNTTANLVDTATLTEIGHNITV